MLGKTLLCDSCGCPGRQVVQTQAWSLAGPASSSAYGESWIACLRRERLGWVAGSCSQTELTVALPDDLMHRSRPLFGVKRREWARTKIRKQKAYW